MVATGSNKVSKVITRPPEKHWVGKGGGWRNRVHRARHCERSEAIQTAPALVDCLGPPLPPLRRQAARPPRGRHRGARHPARARSLGFASPPPPPNDEPSWSATAEMQTPRPLLIFDSGV